MIIIALVGPSGTGKSHRASMVADRYMADAILDDGLLIVDGRIVAGTSAKQEVTRMAAVKRAILLDPEHAQNIRERLAEVHPNRLLLLGTSRNMIAKILSALQIETAAIEWVAIETLATAEEMDSAKRERLQEGKHVIPAPTLEVRKTFSGYLVAPLQFIFYQHGRGHRVTVEKSIVRPTYSQLGRFYIAETVLASISARAGESCPGVRSVPRVIVRAGAEGVRFQLDVQIEHRVHLFAMMELIQQRVRQWVEGTTSLSVVEVAVNARQIALVPDHDQGG